MLKVIIHVIEMAKIKFLYAFYEWYISRGLDFDRMPKHVALIMDGNRRYSKVQENGNIAKGHELGVDTLEKVLSWSIDLGIEIVTAYAFSVENFNRSDYEVKNLMDLFEKNFKKIVTNEKIHKNEVKVKAVGKLDLLPENVRTAIELAEEATANYDKRLLNIAIGYDGRHEIVDAIKNIVKQIKKGEITEEDITVDLVNKNLYTKGIEDPDLIIRTSGEERLSGFLLWQSSYSELYFCDNLWPELRRVDFLRAIRDYQKRDKRYGT